MMQMWFGFFMFIFTFLVSKAPSKCKSEVFLTFIYNSLFLPYFYFIIFVRNIDYNILHKLLRPTLLLEKLLEILEWSTLQK